MEITINNVKNRTEPYQLFLDSIRSPSTLRRYKNLLYTFLKLIPNKIYLESLGKTPKDNEAKTNGWYGMDEIQTITNSLDPAFSDYTKKRIRSIASVIQLLFDESW